MTGPAHGASGRSLRAAQGSVLQQQIGDVGAHMRAIDKAFVRLLESHEGLAAELDARTREVEHLRALLGELEQQNAELTVRLDSMIAERLRGSAQVSTADNFRHQELADRFTTFVQQDLPGLVQPLGDFAGNPAERYQQTARLTARVLGIVLVDAVADAHELLRRLDVEPTEAVLRAADRVCAIADGLHDQAVELDNPQGWILGCTRGERLDPDTQSPWGACDAEAPIEFAVVPGYRANGRTYLRQAVFTSITT
jgi:hypothetical protein